MRLAVITYDVPHLKTQQLLQAFVHEDKLDIALFGLPFVARPSRAPRIRHRPDMNYGGHPATVAAHHGIRYASIAEVEAIGEGFDAVLIAGAGLLPGSFVGKMPVVNGHPGLIPAVRGLASFTWAILHRAPLGVSLHLLDADVDAGKHLKSVPTPVYYGDTLETLAGRHYENEIVLLARFARYLLRPEDPLPGLHERPARRRMPRETEDLMITRFDDYVRRFARPAETP